MQSRLCPFRHWRPAECTNLRPLSTRILIRLRKGSVRLPMEPNNLRPVGFQQWIQNKHKRSKRNSGQRPADDNWVLRTRAAVTPLGPTSARLEAPKISSGCNATLEPGTIILLTLEPNKGVVESQQVP